jgi:hypothetical protein
MPAREFGSYYHFKGAPASGEIESVECVRQGATLKLVVLTTRRAASLPRTRAARKCPRELQFFLNVTRSDSVDRAIARAGEIFRGHEPLAVIRLFLDLSGQPRCHAGCGKHKSVSSHPASVD